MGNSDTRDASPPVDKQALKWRAWFLSVVGGLIALIAIVGVIDPAKTRDNAEEEPAAAPAPSSKIASTSDPARSVITASETASTGPPDASTELPAGFVSRDGWSNGEWPLTVDDAVVKCQGDGVVTIAVRGPKEYALNAAAAGQTELPDAIAITKLDPARPGSHLDVSKLIERGLNLCDSRT